MNLHYIMTTNSEKIKDPARECGVFFSIFTLKMKTQGVILS